MNTQEYQLVYNAYLYTVQVAAAHSQTGKLSQLELLEIAVQTVTKAVDENAIRLDRGNIRAIARQIHQAFIFQARTNQGQNYQDFIQ